MEVRHAPPCVRCEITSLTDLVTRCRGCTLEGTASHRFLVGRKKAFHLPVTGITERIPKTHRRAEAKERKKAKKAKQTNTEKSTKNTKRGKAKEIPASRFEKAPPWSVANESLKKDHRPLNSIHLVLEFGRR